MEDIKHLRIDEYLNSTKNTIVIDLVSTNQEVLALKSQEFHNNTQRIFTNATKITANSLQLREAYFDVLKTDTSSVAPYFKAPLDTFLVEFSTQYNDERMVALVKVLPYDVYAIYVKGLTDPRIPEGETPRVLVVESVMIGTEGGASRFITLPIIAFMVEGFDCIGTEAHKWDGTGFSEEVLGTAKNNMNTVCQQLYVLVIMMNTKNATTQVQVLSPEKLNKSRAKKGKYKYSGYTNIELLTGEQFYKNSTGKTGSSKSRHLVRGHMKKRKTGLYWWEPHMAGGGDELKRKAYIVK